MITECRDESHCICFLSRYKIGRMGPLMRHTDNMMDPYLSLPFIGPTPLSISRRHGLQSPHSITKIGNLMNIPLTASSILVRQAGRHLQRPFPHWRSSERDEVPVKIIILGVGNSHPVVCTRACFKGQIIKFLQSLSSESLTWSRARWVGLCLLKPQGWRLETLSPKVCSLNFRF